MTYENIMNQMMADMPDDIDTSEGSLLFNACAKQAVRLEEAYMQLRGIEANMYADTADIDHLIREGNDRGCYINEATFGEFTAQFNCEVPLGSRWNHTIIRCSMRLTMYSTYIESDVITQDRNPAM